MFTVSTAISEILLSIFFNNLMFLSNYGILLFKFLDPTITNGISVSQLKNLSFNLEVSFAHNQVRVSYLSRPLLLSIVI
jgi:hypothetical protein